MNLIDYLNDNDDISQAQKDNTIAFYSKFEELTSLYKTLIGDNELLMAYGNYDSKICLIFKDKAHLNRCMPNLKRVFDVYNINIWNLLVLYSDKFGDSSDVTILTKELSIVDPIVIYIFDNNGLEKKILKESSKTGVLASKFINVNNLKNLIDINASAKIFDYFKYLVTYDY